MKAKLTLIITGILALFACNNEDSVESLSYEDSAYGVVGRWYAENNVDDPVFNMYAEYVFTADGVIYADEYRKINGFRRDSIQGKYSIKDNNITTEFSINQGGQSTSSLKVTNGLTFAASFHRFSEDYTLTFNRVVGEIMLTVDTMVNVKDELQHNIETCSAQPTEIKGYEMSDESIASVDDSGLVTTKLIGVTFLKVITSAGTAVLKVSVSDENNLWNDFSQVLGKDFSEVEHLLGKHYAFRNDTLFRYYYDNYYIDSVDIYRHENIADSIVVTLNIAIPDSTIMSHLENINKLAYIKDTLSYHWYTDNDNYLFSSYSARYYENSNKIIYLRQDPDWDDRIDDYGLTAEELLLKYGSYSRKDNNTLSFYGIKNEFVGEITYYLNPKVYKYRIVVNMNITKDMIIEYVNRKFLYWNIIHPYAKNIQINGKEMILEISFKGNSSEDYSRSLDYIFIENE
mgnify:CR=1 FL=1